MSLTATTVITTTVDSRSNSSAYNKNPSLTTFLFVPLEVFLLLYIMAITTFHSNNKFHKVSWRTLECKSTVLQISANGNTKYWIPNRQIANTKYHVLQIFKRFCANLKICQIFNDDLEFELNSTKTALFCWSVLP